MSYADLYLVDLRAYDAAYAISGRLPTTWRMTTRYRKRYSDSADVWHLRVHFEPTNWKWKSDGLVTISKAHLARLVEIPENADLATVIYELTLMHSLDVRLARLDAGEPTIPQEEVAKYFQEKYGIQVGD